MAKNDQVASIEHVVRYARPEDVDDGEVLSSAFLRPPKDIDGLSVTRLGILANDIDDDLALIRAIMVSRSMPLDTDSRFAQLSVGDIEDAATEAAALFKVVESASKAKPKEGKLPNPAHAIILGLPIEGTSIGSLTSQLAGDLLVQRINAIHPGWIGLSSSG